MVRHAAGTCAASPISAADSARCARLRKRREAVRPNRRRSLRRILAGATAAILVPCAYISVSASLLYVHSRPTVDHYIAEYSLPGQVARAERIPRSMTDALIAVEDRKFKFHHGVDWAALRGALGEDFHSLSFSHGGSTITMQTVRYLALPSDKTITRKVAEIALAKHLERNVPKSQILLLYCDSVTFGLHTAGLEDASKTYFGVQPQRLTLAQSALLAGLIANPPATVADLPMAAADVVRNRALSALQDRFPYKYSQAQIDDARSETLAFSWQVATPVASHWRTGR